MTNPSRGAISRHIHALVVSLEAQLTAAKLAAAEVSAAWAFFDSVWVEPDPVPEGQAEAKVSVYMEERSCTVRIKMRTWEEAIAYAKRYERQASQLSLVTDRCTMTKLPVGIWDYGYGHKPGTSREVYGIFAISVHGSGGRHGFHAEELHFSVADPAANRRVDVEIEVQESRFYVRAHPDRYVPPKVGVKAHKVTYDNEVSHDSDGRILDGRYRFLYMLQNDDLSELLKPVGVR